MATAKEAYNFVLVSPATSHGLIKGTQMKETIVWNSFESQWINIAFNWGLSVGGDEQVQGTVHSQGKKEWLYVTPTMDASVETL